MSTDMKEAFMSEHDEIDINLDRLSQQIIDLKVINIDSILNDNELADIYVDAHTTISSASIQKTQLMNIDVSLQTYYNRLGCNKYTNNFINYIIKEELNDISLPVDDELGEKADPYQCQYIDFINSDEFPLPRHITISTENIKLFIFYLLQYCYKYSHSPSDKYIAAILVPKVQQQSISSNAVL
eukprot:394070_1